MRLLPYGDRAVLVELPDPATRRLVAATLRRLSWPWLTELVPAARTVLLRVADPADLPLLVGALRDLSPDDDAGTEDAREVEVAVAYDGADLADVADLLGVDAAEVVRRHTGQGWTVDFSGFSPGFGYLVGDEGGLEVPRRERPRTRIPAGAVALAGEYTGVYPRPSPGGWQLIGTTSELMWDERRAPPALLSPGTRVRFREVDR